LTGLDVNVGRGGGGIHSAKGLLAGALSTLMAIMLPNSLRKNRTLEGCLQVHLEVGLRAQGVSAVEGRSLVNMARSW